MRIEVKGGVEFMVIDLVDDTEHLNPFHVNISLVRYMREYVFSKPNEKNGIAIFIGNKMLVTRDTLGLDDCRIGQPAKIGSLEFSCVEGSSLTDKGKGRYFINYRNALYMRKFVDKNDKSGKSDKFAVITIDERIIPVDQL